MFDKEAIGALLQKYGSFEVYVHSTAECNSLIKDLNSIGFRGGSDMMARSRVPYPYFHLHRGWYLGGNYKRKRSDSPFFTFDEFYSKFNLGFCPEDDIQSMDSVF